MITPEGTITIRLKQLVEEVKQGKRGLLTTAEVCTLLGKSKMTMSRWTREGKIPHFRLNGAISFDPGQVLHWLCQRNLRPN